jgi:hypothetical protein
MVISPMKRPPPGETGEGRLNKRRFHKRMTVAAEEIFLFVSSSIVKDGYDQTPLIGSIR